MGTRILNGVRPVLLPIPAHIQLHPFRILFTGSSSKPIFPSPRKNVPWPSFRNTALLQLTHLLSSFHRRCTALKASSCREGVSPLSCLVNAMGTQGYLAGWRSRRGSVAEKILAWPRTTAKTVDEVASASPQGIQRQGVGVG